MDLRFHRVACRNIAAELPDLAVVGYSPEGPVFEDPIQGGGFSSCQAVVRVWNSLSRPARNRRWQVF